MQPARAIRWAWLLVYGWGCWPTTTIRSCSFLRLSGCLARHRKWRLVSKVVASHLRPVSVSTDLYIAAARRHDVIVPSVGRRLERERFPGRQESVPFNLYGQWRPGTTAASTAVPSVLLTRKGSQVQTLSRPPGTTSLSVPRTAPLVSRLSADHFL